MPSASAVSNQTVQIRPLEARAEQKKPRFLAKLAYHLFPIRRGIVLQNMRLVFGDRLSSQEITALAQNAYGHFLVSLGENLLIGFMPKSWLKSRVRIVGYEHVLNAAKQNKGILLLTGHIGNWEFAPMAGMLHFEQFKGRFHVLRRQLVNKWIERIVFRRFYEAGLDVIPKKNSLNRVLQCLASNDVVVYIMDQHAKPGKDGVVADFFGKKAGTFKSLAMIARTTGAAVIPSYNYREEDGRHVTKFLEPLPWIERPDPDEEILENTQNYNRVLEKIILEHPEQWWWVHRRWKVNEQTTSATVGSGSCIANSSRAKRGISQ